MLNFYDITIVLINHF